MPVSIAPPLTLWAVLLSSGYAAGPRADFEAIFPSRHLLAMAFASDPVPAIEAMSPGMEWPWRISEAVTTEEESDDDLCPLKDEFERGRPHGDRSVMSSVRPDRGNFRFPFRSPILRC